MRNPEALFPEWGGGLEDESWEEVLPEPPLSETPYPPRWGAERITTLRSLLGIEETESKSRKKEPAKRKDQRPEFIDAAVDAAGNPLPRVLVDSSAGDFLGNSIPRAFIRRETSSASDESESGDVRMVDPALCAAFLAVERFSDRCDLSPQNFLWRSIYPQSAEGRPCFNPSGKYCVKLHLAGAWRRVAISDSVPVDAEGALLLAQSSDPLELWPSLLAKAVYSAVAACG